MQRRSFITAVGGTVILAACGSDTSGNSVQSDFPADTVQAWAGPSAGLASDVGRWAVSYAILAPNPHNRQPWIVDLREDNAITLYCDRNRMLTHTDPFGRQILIGHGAFLEILAQALAQQGIAADVHLFPQGEQAPALADWDARPIARVTLGQVGSAKSDALFAQVLKRHTPKIDFDTSREISAQTQGLLQQAGTAFGAQAGGTLQADKRDALRQLCWESAKVELLTPRTVMESVQLTRVGPTEIRANPDGITLNSPMIRIFDSLGMFDRSNPPTEGSQAYKIMMSRFEGHSKTAMGFVWVTTSDNSRATQVNAGRAYVRLQLQATALGVGVHPMSQALQEFAEMRTHYQRAHELVLGERANLGHIVQMLCRVGYPAKPAGATPRRDLARFIQG